MKTSVLLAYIFLWSIVGIMALFLLTFVVVGSIYMISASATTMIIWIVIVVFVGLSSLSIFAIIAAKPQEPQP